MAIVDSRPARDHHHGMNRMSTRVCFALVCAALLIAAGGCGKSPGSVAVQFETDWGTGKFADAEKLLSKNSAASFDQAAQAVGGRDALLALLEQTRQANPATITKVDVGVVTVVNTKATAHYKTTDSQGKTSDEREMSLVKEDGQWKVDFDQYRQPWNRVAGVPRQSGGGGQGRGAGGGAGGRGRRGTTQPTN
jgi:hypothetical protein